MYAVANDLAMVAMIVTEYELYYTRIKMAADASDG
jgi:hypothetical protein